MAFQVGLGTAATLNPNGVIYTNTTSIGNIGAGPDVLHSYTLLANALASSGKSLCWRAAGTIANNANPKTLVFRNATQTLLSCSLPINIAADWFAFIVLARETGLRRILNVRVRNQATGAITTFTATGTVTAGAGVVNDLIVEANTATADNDIIQNFSLIWIT